MVYNKKQKEVQLSSLVSNKSSPVYGKVQKITKNVSRIMASNAGPFTFYGTGTYIIGKDNLCIIDPGPNDQTHINNLLSFIKNKKVSHLLITHTHADHSPASKAIKEATGALRVGFGPHGLGKHKGPKFEEFGDMEFIPDYFIKDGETIKGDGWTVQAVFTPGHTSNHMSYAFVEEKILFTGDHVMGWSTTVIVPPDGDMGDYMESLRKLLKREDSLYIPTHGEPIKNPKRFVRALINHRKMRENQLLVHLRKKSATINEMIPRFYATTNIKLWPAASKSLLALLLYLERSDYVRCDNHNDYNKPWSLL